MQSESSRVLGLDVGSVRIGVAITDPDRKLATPRGSVPFNVPHQVTQALQRLLPQEWDETALIVIGVPISLDGTEGERAKQIRSWGVELARQSLKEVRFFDERFSTKEAWRLLQEAGKNTRRGRSIVDGAAAALILEGWLGSSR